MANDLGELRRSSVIQTWGPGAIVDFRTKGKYAGPVSAVMTGLEDWDKYAGPPGLQNKQVIYEPRLQKALNIAGFRLPPVGGDDKHRSVKLRATRFPLWLQCPKCDTLRFVDGWTRHPGKAAPTCPMCSGSKPVPVIPVRFIMACSNGHLDDFPWHLWVGHKDGCSSKDLKLTTRGAGLAGVYVSCPKCNASKSLNGIFSESTMERLGVSCKGKRPWLHDREDCSLTPRVLQRGASNTYFPIIQSALSIPPWSDRLQQILGHNWDDLVNVQGGVDRQTMYIEMVLIDKLRREGVFDTLQVTEEELKTQLIDRVKQIDSMDTSTLRKEEYLQLSGPSSKEEEGSEFMTRQEPVPDEVSQWVGSLVRVVRLREVRALRGFTRIVPFGSEPGGEDEPGSSASPLSKERKPWLPAIEVRGEGIFLELDNGAVREWEQRPSVQARFSELKALAVTNGNTSVIEKLDFSGPRMLLIHALAHALIRQLTLECGYASASLRERLYVEQGDDQKAGMCGLLIYTADSDADGTLGGLERQGKAARFGNVLIDAVRSLQWCSSDPLCIEGALSTSSPMNFAACHACLLLAETSCEEFNQLLDRAMLIGSPASPQLGFFSDLVGA